MDQERAQILFREGATLVILGVPERTEIGIDYNNWTVGPKFKGVKMIPPGMHFVYYSAVGSDNQQAPRTGFFYNFKSKEILVKKWDNRAEDIVDAPVNPDEDMDQVKMDMDRFLGPYPYDNYKKWVSLTNHMRAELVLKLQPLHGQVSAVTQFLSESSTTQSRKEAAESAMDVTENGPTEAGLPHMNTVPGTELRLTAIPRRKYPEGATPTEISRCQMDSSYALQRLLEHEYKDNVLDILGEIQFVFICFLIGQHYDAFEQWKRLVHLVCTCDEALSHTACLTFFQQFIGMMHFHIKEIPEDFFVDIVSQNNFLTGTLSEFFSNLEASSADAVLKERGLKFKASLQKRFKWDFSTEPGDYAPVIVQ